MKRLTLTILALAALSAPASAHHEKTIPTKLSTLERIYPDLHARTLRDRPVSWAKLRRMSASRWRATHPLAERRHTSLRLAGSCAPADLRLAYRSGRRSSWDTMVKTWECDGVAASQVSFMSCIAPLEGGKTFPDVRYGGGRGYPGTGSGNIVFGHLQLRPAWYRGAMQGRPGVYAMPDAWDYELYEFARDPVNQARATAPLGAGNYATKSFCL